MKKKFRYDGVDYDSLEEMPDDVRTLFEKNGEPSEGHEDEYEAELRGDAGEDLLEKERAGKEADRLGGIGPVWRAGIVAAGVALFGFGAFLLHIWYRVSWPRLNNPFWYAGLFLVLSGVGLVMLRRWARIMTLCGVPVLLAVAVPLYMRRSDAPFAGVLLAFIATCALSFLYLILPPVVRQFRGKPRSPESVMRIARLAPPPRPVPFSLRLALTWGSHAGMIFTLVTAIVTLPTVIKLKPVLAGIDFRDDPGFLFLLFIPLAFIAALMMAMRLVIKSGRCDVEMLEKGCLTYARIVKKVSVKAGDTRMFRVYYEYEVNGKKYKAWDDTYYTARIEDEAQEPLIYLPKRPSMCALLDTFPAHIDADATGHWVHRFPFMGFVYPAIPVAVLTAAVYLALK